MNPPFSSDGTTPTHCAEPITSSGMPLSGAAMISSRIVPAASTRSATLSRAPAAQAALTNVATTHRIKSLFIAFPVLGATYAAPTLEICVCILRTPTRRRKNLRDRTAIHDLWILDARRGEQRFAEKNIRG